MVKHQVLSYGLLLNRSGYQDEFLKKVVLVTSLDTLNHAITDTLLGKEESLGLQSFFAFLRPFVTLLENLGDSDPTRLCESQSTLCYG